jgi:hypothetical protein
MWTQIADKDCTSTVAHHFHSHGCLTYLQEHGVTFIISEKHKKQNRCIFILHCRFVLKLSCKLVKAFKIKHIEY